jgi:hypothetical protein
MDPVFKNLVESLHGSFLEPIQMKPVTAASLPRKVPEMCVYLFSEGGRHLYAGRTNSFKQRIGGHSRPSSGHNSAVFACKLAKEKTGKVEATYAREGSRAALENDPVFAGAFTDAKARVRSMDLRFIEEQDQLRQALLEIYVSAVLKTPYNDFETH